MAHIHRDDPVKILVAMAIGFAAGLLLAPRSGAETRARLRSQSEEMKARMKMAARDVKEHAKEGKASLRDAASTAKQAGRDVKADLRSGGAKPGE